MNALTTCFDAKPARLPCRDPAMPTLAIVHDLVSIHIRRLSPPNGSVSNEICGPGQYCQERSGEEYSKNFLVAANRCHCLLFSGNPLARKPHTAFVIRIAGCDLVYIVDLTLVETDSNS